jgi:peptidoglycan hydrolase CwlO-like protein
MFMRPEKALMDYITLETDMYKEDKNKELEQSIEQIKSLEMKIMKGDYSYKEIKPLKEEWKSLDRKIKHLKERIKNESAI